MTFEGGQSVEAVAERAAGRVAPEDGLAEPGDAEEVEAGLVESGAAAGAGLQSEMPGFFMCSGRLGTGGFCAEGVFAGLCLDAAGVF